MLRHTGQKRNFTHNVRLAALLCLTAGFVNAAGFLAFLVLTTNVTGHAALLAIKLTSEDFRSARVVTLWLFLFLAGAFLSSLYIARTGRDKAAAYTVPIVLEMLILVIVGKFGYKYDKTIVKTEYFAGMLLFAMGMQNALVSIISGSVVRTTHLTGIFTDLGIDLSTAVLGGRAGYASVRKKIILRMVIILFFLTGGVIGSYCYSQMHYHAFYIPAGILVVAMLYDYFRVALIKMKSQFSHELNKLQP